MRIPALGALLAMLLSACSLDYSKGQMSETMDKEVPHTVLNNFIHTRVSRGTPLFILSAEQASVFEEPNQTILKNAVFREFSEEGELLTQGKAERIVFQNNSEDARLSGEILVYSAREEARITAREIQWKKEKKQLTSGGQTLVSLLQNDGSRIEGRGFKADFRYNTFEFSQGVEGVYHSTEETDKEGKSP